MAINYEILAHNLMDLVGGKENVAQLTHCITRLRFQLKNKELVNDEEIKKIQGLIGTQWSGEQYQVIVGPAVGKAYDAVCKEMGINEGKAETTETKNKITIKGLFSSLISNLSACIYPVLPIFMASGLVGMMGTIFGPSMLGVLSEDSNTYKILVFAYNSGFYFLPIFLGYTSAKHLKMSPLMGMLMGAILVHPTLIGLATEGGTLDFLGLPVTVVKYSGSVMPIILCVWFMSYVEKFLNKYTPESVATFLVPFGTIILSLPVCLCALAPLGNILSVYISDILLAIKNIFGPIGTGILSAIYFPLIMTGMHHTINAIATANFLALGYDEFVKIAYPVAFVASMAICLVCFIKSKKTTNKNVSGSSFFMLTVAGLSEPAIYGVILPHKAFIASLFAGAFAGGTFMGLMNVRVYTLTSANILGLLRFVGGSSSNFIYAMIGCAITFVVSFVAAWILYREKED